MKVRNLFEMLSSNRGSTEVEENIPAGNNPAEVKEQNQPEGNKPAENGSPNTDDLLSRVTKFVETENPENKSEEEIDEGVYNDAEFRTKIDAIEDPELKNYMISLRKSGVRGVNEKLGQIAEIRKELESLKTSQNDKWTPERIQRLINDPEFLQAAQSVVGSDFSQNSDDDEYVPESVKNKLKELDNIKKQLGTFQQQQTQAQLEHEHQMMKQKYGNYNPQKIDEIRKDLIEGRVRANSEHLYWAFQGPDNVKKAYEMGLRDARNGVSDNKELSSFSGGQTRPNQDIKPEDNESDKSFLRRIISKNLSAKK